jgi:8-oxo-dGTP pyrophosphatase MutT (NUDIX family)
VPDGRLTRNAGRAFAGAAAPGEDDDAAATSSADLEILLMRRSPRRILPGLWQCVSGSLEEGESVTDGALRELLEETGFGPAQIAGFYDLDQVNQFHEPSYRAIVTSAIFAVRVSAGAQPVLSHEHDAMRWATPAQALELAVWPAYRESIRRIVDNLVDPARAIWFELTMSGDRARR